MLSPFLSEFVEIHSVFLYMKTLSSFKTIGMCVWGCVVWGCGGAFEFVCACVGVSLCVCVCVCVCV